MDEKSKYYHITETKNSFILDDRVEINWIEILLYPTAIFLFLFIGTGYLIPSIAVTIVVAILYTIFRFFAWFIYKEVVINLNDGTIIQRKKFISKVKSIIKIDKDFNFEKLTFIEQTRSGQTKFILQYKTYKTFDLLIIKNQEQKQLIENNFKKIKTNHNKELW